MFANVALAPTQAALSDQLVSLAQKNCPSDDADVYRLGDNALPHITLCQFAIPLQGETTLDAVWGTVQGLLTEPMSIRFHSMYALPGRQVHAGRTWIGLTILPTPPLGALQWGVVQGLLDCGITGETATETYFPHLTFARLKEGIKPHFTAMPGPELCDHDYSFRLTIGLSDDARMGIYRKCLYPR
jgi:hypothetical protein